MAAKIRNNYNHFKLLNIFLSNSKWLMAGEKRQNKFIIGVCVLNRSARELKLFLKTQLVCSHVTLKLHGSQGLSWVTKRFSLRFIFVERRHSGKIFAWRFFRKFSIDESRDANFEMSKLKSFCASNNKSNQFFWR